ncbi:GNAT family N-acetyltransferase [Bacillus sp. YC2]|uniref:GNAT family N-acetyltransferase n=1 Tax=Bacillus sp. YC2 TaxID=2861287 RepID=UPI001CA732F6|nr:GNAT family N-acetyltransferase [Bacillus sp. YC2]
MTAKAFINHCLTCDMAPGWDCDVNNMASVSLAEKLGCNEPANIFCIRENLKIGG